MTKRARFATLAISMIVDNFCLLQQYKMKQNQNTIAAIDHKRARLQNSPYFCVFKYARAVKQKVCNEAENSERDWGETLKTRSIFFSRLARTSYGRTHVRLARFARVRLLRYTFEKKTDCFAIYKRANSWPFLNMSLLNLTDQYTWVYIEIFIKNSKRLLMITHCLNSLKATF